MSENVENVVEYDADEILCEIVNEGDDYFLVDLASNEKSGPLSISSDGVAFALPKNRANRKWATINKVKAYLEAGQRYTMTYKATRKFGPVGTRLPNEKLISYLPVEDQEEYKAIIARAIEARNADKVKPKTELEKAQESLAKAKAKLDKLLAEAAE